MQLEPRGIWSLLGIEAGNVYPTAVNCPLCHEYNKLEVRTTDHIYCTSCHFNGDILELLSLVRDEPLEDTVVDLQSRALLDESDDGIEEYLKARNVAMAVKELVFKKARQMWAHVPPSIMAMLDSLKCRFTPATVKRLLPHICHLRRDDVEGLVQSPKEAKEPLKWLGKYTALAIPAWYRSDIVGFWLVTQKGYNYLPVLDSATSAAFGRVPSFMDDVTFVVDNPISALRMTIWSILETGKPVGFVVPYGLTDDCDTYGGKRTIFWSTEGDSRWYMRAIKSSGVQTIDHHELGADFDPLLNFPCRGSFEQFKRLAINSLPAHQAAAQELLKLSEDAVKAVLVGFSVDANDRAKIAASAQGEDSQRLLNLFDSTIREASISWDGVTISDTPEGWKAKGKIISAAKFQIDQIRPTGTDGEAIVTGSVIYNKQSIRFKEKISRIRKNPGDWLVRKVIANFGSCPWVETSWKNKLLEVAQQFHTPKAVLAGDQYGWDDKKLRMPNFMVDAQNLYVTRSMVEGPGALLPPPLSLAEWDGFKSPAFCRLVLTLMGTLLRTSQERIGMGILLTNEPHVVSHLAHSFGASVVTNPTLDEIEDNSLAPLPLFMEWTGSHLREVFEKDGYKNVCVSVDSHVAKLSMISPDWVHLRVGTQVEYPALRIIFILLPYLLRSTEINVDGDTFYRDVADIIAPYVKEHCSRHSLTQAAADLDTFHIYRTSTAGSRIIQLMFYGVGRGDITPSIDHDKVIVKHDQFLAATASAVVPMPPINELTKRLIEARFLIEDCPGEWHLSRITWDMNASLVSCL